MLQLVVASGGAEPEVLLLHVHPRTHPLEPDDGLSGNAAVTTELHGTDPLRRGRVVQDVFVERRDLDQDLALGDIPIKRDESLRTLEAGGALGDRCDLGAGREGDA